MEFTEFLERENIRALKLNKQEKQRLRQLFVKCKNARQNLVFEFLARTNVIQDWRVMTKKLLMDAVAVLLAENDPVRLNNLAQDWMGVECWYYSRIRCWLYKPYAFWRCEVWRRVRILHYRLSISYTRLRAKIKPSPNRRG